MLTYPTIQLKLHIIITSQHNTSRLHSLLYWGCGGIYFTISEISIAFCNATRNWLFSCLLFCTAWPIRLSPLFWRGAVQLSSLIQVRSIKPKLKKMHKEMLQARLCPFILRAQSGELAGFSNSLSFIGSPGPFISCVIWYTKTTFFFFFFLL